MVVDPCRPDALLTVRARHSDSNALLKVVLPQIALKLAPAFQSRASYIHESALPFEMDPERFKIQRFFVELAPLVGTTFDHRPLIGILFDSGDIHEFLI